MSNHPEGSNVFVELTPELAAFLLDNCDANLEMGLGLISEPSISQSTVVAIVDKMEKFKGVRAAVKDAMP